MPSTTLIPHPYLGFSGRLALIPFESPGIVGSSPCSGTVGSAGDFSGTRRKRHGCRPNRTPAAGRRDRRQSIGPPQPFPETCAASGIRRVARLRAASCATPASLPSASPRPGHGRDSRHLPFGEWTRACLSRGGARRVAKSFSGPTGLATRRFTSRGRCGSESQRSYSPRGVLSGDARKSSERAAPRAAAVDKKPVCHCPVRKSGIRVDCQDRLTLRKPSENRARKLNPIESGEKHFSRQSSTAPLQW